MRRIILCGIWVAIVSLMFAIPTNAYSDRANGNDGLGNGMGTRTNSTHDGITANLYGTKMNAQSHDSATRTKATPNHEISVYGTGTGSQFFNVNANTSGMDRNPVNHTQTYMDGGYRTMETTSSRGMGWGWLGLLGLIGLFGIRSRNPQRDR
jgi:MYXO-CTERM domain-containing protein